MSQPAAAPATAAKSAKKKKPIVLLTIVGVLILAMSGAAGAYFYMHRDAAPPPPPEQGIAALEPFTVNLADPGGQRFLRVTLGLVLETAEQAKELEENTLGLARARSSILELLTLQTADRLVTSDGKTQLKREIAERATHALGHAKVVDVLFTEFVVQF